MLQSDPVSSETKAYAIEAEALIETFRMGVETEMREDVVHLTAEYIRTGKNKDNQAWKDFIATRLK